MFMALSNIEASLSCGNFLSKKQLGFLYISMVICLIMPLLTLILIIIPQVEWDSKLILTMTLVNIIFLSFLGVMIYVKVKNDKIKKKIIMWLYDAVELKAYCKKVDENRLGIQPKAVKIQVKFEYNNKTYSRESTAKIFGGQQGYLSIYKKYVNKKIRILYSPKYDEVMILKEPKY